MAIRVADILAVGGRRFLATHRVPPVVARAVRAIVSCRKQELGGHVKKCEQGHVIKAWYNACRNRSCPRCSFYRVRVWLERQAKTLLGCAHHHIIFTIPHELNGLWLCNYALMGDLLFSSAREALFTLAADAKYLAARPGVIMALHTWGQQLPMHPHVHCLATAGGVDAEGNWVPSPRKHFLPAEPLKRLFRGKFLSGLRSLGRQGRLRLPDGWGLAELERMCDEVEHKRWNVHVRERYSNPSAVLNYLGRYLNGGPIGESRLVSFDGETVHLRYKDYRDQGREKILPLSCDEFIRRYLQHIPPRGFHMVRGYGLYRRGGNTEALRQHVREVVPITPELRAALTTRLPEVEDPTDQLVSCPTCGARLIIVDVPRAGPLRMAA